VQDSIFDGFDDVRVGPVDSGASATPPLHQLFEKGVSTLHRSFSVPFCFTGSDSGGKLANKIEKDLPPTTAYTGLHAFGTRLLPSVSSFPLFQAGCALSLISCGADLLPTSFSPTPTTTESCLRSLDLPSTIILIPVHHHVIGRRKGGEVYPRRSVDDQRLPGRADLCRRVERRILPVTRSCRYVACFPCSPRAGLCKLHPGLYLICLSLTLLLCREGRRCMYFCPLESPVRR